MKMKSLNIALWFIIISLQLFAQDPNWKVYTSANSGLPALNLYDIAIDKNDIKWIAAEFSIIRFDGNTWDVFDSSNSIIPPEFWTGIVERGGDGNAWLGGHSAPFLTNVGLVNISSTPWIVYDTSNSELAHMSVASLTPSRDGGIWINSWPGYLTSTGAIQKLTNGNWFNSTQSSVVYSFDMEEDLNGNLWYVGEPGAGGGVFKIVGDTTLVYNFLDGLAMNLETDIYGNIWMGWFRETLDSSGLLMYDDEDWIFYNQYNSNLPPYWAENLVTDSIGNLWMSREGLIKYDGLIFTHYTPQNSGLYSTDIGSIQIDDSNNKWIIHPDAISVFNEDGITSVEIGDELPNNFTLLQNYPNPFNPNTKIRYSIPQYSNVIIKVYDILGNEIETLVNEEKPTGTFEITWYAEGLPSGIYFYRLQAGSFVETKKMVLMK